MNTPTRFQDLEPGVRYRATDNPNARFWTVARVETSDSTVTIHHTHGPPRRLPVWTSKRAFTGNAPTRSTRTAATRPKRVSERAVKFNAWSEQVQTRDGHICRVCRSARSVTTHHVIKQGDINAHHPTDWKYDLSNGVAICWKCHADVHATDNAGKPTMWIMSGIEQAKQFMTDGGEATLPRNEGY